MPNVIEIIEGDNKKKQQVKKSKSSGKQCSSPRKVKCPLQGKFLSRGTVKCDDN